MAVHKCFICAALLKKDHVALNKKLFGLRTTKLHCLPCMADNLGCDIEDLLIKIEELKEEGCTLFK